jgi:hypothetical protein
MVSIRLTGAKSGVDGEWGVAGKPQILMSFDEPPAVAGRKKEGRRNGDLLALPMATQDQGAVGTDWGGMGGHLSRL